MTFSESLCRMELDPSLTVSSTWDSAVSPAALHVAAYQHLGWRMINHYLMFLMICSNLNMDLNHYHPSILNTPCPKPVNCLFNIACFSLPFILPFFLSLFPYDSTFLAPHVLYPFPSIFFYVLYPALYHFKSNLFNYGAIFIYTNKVTVSVCVCVSGWDHFCMNLE